jgi:hypothetical protein
VTTRTTPGAADRRGNKKSDTTVSENPQGTEKPTRLSVNISPATEQALQMLADREGVTTTEALRRLVGYGRVLYEATAVDGDDVLIRRGEHTERIIIV